MVGEQNKRVVADSKSIGPANGPILFGSGGAANNMTVRYSKTTGPAEWTQVCSVKAVHILKVRCKQ